MKNSAQLIIYSFILVLLASCIKEEAILEGAQYELMARMETDARTKTSLSGLQDGKYYPLWSAGDEIAVYVDGDESPVKYTLNSGEGTTEAVFSGIKEGNDYLAIYPFNVASSQKNGKISLILPQIQQYVKDSFGPGSYPMVAIGTKDGLEFKNLCAVIKISIKGEAIIRSIKITAKDSNIFVSGPAAVPVSYDIEPALDMLDGGSNSVVLECNDVVLSQDSVTDFHIVIPAQTYTGGLEISIDTYMETIQKNIDVALKFQRSQLRHLSNMELKIQVDEHQLKLMKERDALLKIYDALEGDNWCYKYDNSDIRNENWCSDKPVGQWEGITTDSQGYVTHINLYGCNLTGSIPADIGVFSELQELSFANNNITGNIPVEISKLSQLEYLLLFNNRLDGEIPEELMCLTNLKEFRISNNRLVGMIPSGIGNLKELEFLQLGGNRLTGRIPETICNLSKLERIQLGMNRLTGPIPSEIGNLSNLEELWLEENFLEGPIPESIMRLSNLKEMRLFTNYLSGEIPESFYDWQYWKGWWGFCLWQNSYDFSNIRLPGPEGRITCFNGTVINLPEEYKNNKYTILFQWTSGRYPELGEETSFIMPQIKYIHENCSDKGIKIIGWGNSYGDTRESALQYIESMGMTWDNFYYDAKDVGAHYHFNDKIENTFGNIPYYPSYKITTITIVDSTGRIAFSDVFDRKIYEKDGYLKELIENDLKPINEDFYKSKDYSQDGVINSLQRASEGAGINIVLMGDGYSDRQIEDGTYLKDMNFAYNNIFSKEPYKTYQHLFNVSYVNLVSPTEGFDNNDTALNCGFGTGTHVFGNDKTAFNHARKVVGDDKMDETLVVVILNSNKYAGTCYMYYPSAPDTDYGEGVAIAYFPKGGGQNTFSELLHHEACGHGFTKLADEYAYESNGAIPSDEVERIKNQHNIYGWWKNVDFTNDPAQVRWKKFLEDSRYANEGLGVFEGGLTYWSGVWRPTENSIMRHNRGEFNAPSREAIYYRIHKLAYGEDWKYDYEKFVEYDAVNRKSQAASTKSYVLPLKPQPALHPPVVVGKNWREAE